MRSFRLAVLGVALATPALAQQPAPGTAAVAPPVGEAARAPERVERHIADLRKRLGITTAQQPQWDAFAGVMRQNAGRMAASYRDRQARQANMTALDDLRAYAGMERARAEDVERLVTPFAALYESMSAEQRAAADKTFHEFQRGPRGKGGA